MKFRKTMRFSAALELGLLLLIQAGALRIASAYPVDNDEGELHMEPAEESPGASQEVLESSQEPPAKPAVEGDESVGETSLRQGKADQDGGNNLFSGLSNFTLPTFPPLSNLQAIGSRSNPNLILGSFSVLTIPMPGMSEIANGIMSNPFLQNAFKPPSFPSG